LAHRSEPRIVASGGYTIYVELCNEISLECNRMVHALYYALLEARRRGDAEGIVEVVPAYTTVAILYDPRKTRRDRVESLVRRLLSEAPSISSSMKPQRFRIPVVYGGVYGPDLEEVARMVGLSPDEVVEIHTSRSYVCYMLGFTPGFIYLGEVDERIAVPRLPRPRTQVAAGSVGIAGRQTGVYGIDSPGGWRIIGRTPLRMFDHRREPPTPIRPGDIVEFYRVDEARFAELRGRFVGEAAV